MQKYGTARQATDDNIVRRMRFACWITKATDTHSVCVILIAFARQQWLRERASILRYTYIAINETRDKLGYLRADVSCACELMLLLYVVSCLVRYGHKFDFELVVN